MRNKYLEDPLISQLMEETYAMGSISEDKNSHESLNFYFEDQNKVIGSKDKMAYFEFNLNKKEILFFNLSNLKNKKTFRCIIAGYLIDFPYEWSQFKYLDKFMSSIGRGITKISPENDEDKLIEVLQPFCPYDCEIALVCYKFKTYLIFVPTGHSDIFEWIETLIEL
ncbi:MAG: hypothetical protein OEY33_07645 [Bdellovibrionales bacterium]|jgi:hypothetical protein|nr:hypothetical protein [Bdellovibrionales bacterium]